MIQQTSERIVQYQNEMKILILYGVIGLMATVDSALFSSSAIRVIKMIVLSLLHISLNRALAKLRVWLKHSAHRPIPISKSPRIISFKVNNFRYNFITVALHASAFVTVFNILLWTVGYGMASGSHSFAVLLFAVELALTNSMKSFYHTINEYAIHSAPGKR